MKSISSIIILVCSIYAIAAPQNAFEAKNLPDVSTFSLFERNWIETKLSPAQVDAAVQQYAEKIKNKEISENGILIASKELQQWSKYRYFESDTTYSRRWLANLLKFYEALANAKRKLYVLETLNKQKTPEYAQWSKYYATTAQQLIALSKKPLKANDKRELNKLNKEKVAVAKLLKKSEETSQDIKTEKK